MGKCCEKCKICGHCEIESLNQTAFLKPANSPNSRYLCQKRSLQLYCMKSDISVMKRQKSNRVRKRGYQILCPRPYFERGSVIYSVCLPAVILVAWNFEQRCSGLQVVVRVKLVSCCWFCLKELHPEEEVMKTSRSGESVRRGVRDCKAGNGEISERWWAFRSIAFRGEEPVVYLV